MSPSLSRAGVHFTVATENVARLERNQVRTLLLATQALLMEPGRRTMMVRHGDASAERRRGDRRYPEAGGLLPEPVASARPALGSGVSSGSRPSAGRCGVVEGRFARGCARGRGRGSRHRCLGNPLAARRDHQATPEERCGKNDMDRANRREPTAARDMLGVVMKQSVIVGMKHHRNWTWWHC